MLKTFANANARMVQTSYYGGEDPLALQHTRALNRERERERWRWSWPRRKPIDWLQISDPSFSGRPGDSGPLLPLFVKLLHSPPPVLDYLIRYSLCLSRFTSSSLSITWPRILTYLLFLFFAQPDSPSRHSAPWHRFFIAFGHKVCMF